MLISQSANHPTIFLTVILIPWGMNARAESDLLPLKLALGVIWDRWKCCCC